MKRMEQAEDFIARNGKSIQMIGGWAGYEFYTLNGVFLFVPGVKPNWEFDYDLDIRDNAPYKL